MKRRTYCYWCGSEYKFCVDITSYRKDGTPKEKYVWQCSSSYKEHQRCYNTRRATKQEIRERKGEE